MSEHWLVYLIIAAFAVFLYWICDKFQILKSAPLRILVVLLVSSVTCWVVYDLFIAAE